MLKYSFSVGSVLVGFLLVIAAILISVSDVDSGLFNAGLWLGEFFTYV